MPSTVLKMIKVVIVDDKRIIRQNIAAEIDYSDNMQVVFQAQNGLEFLEKMYETAPKGQPEVVLMDIDMPEKNGIDTVRDAKALYPNIEFLMLTVFDEDDKIFEALKAGASGYLLKDEPVRIIIKHIQQVKEHKTVPMSPAIARKTLRFLTSLPVFPKKNSAEFGLSNREKEVLKGLVEGLNYKEIAKKLYVSPHTVRNQITSIYKKLHVKSKVDAVKIAMKNKIV